MDLDLALRIIPAVIIIGLLSPWIIEIFGYEWTTYKRNVIWGFIILICVAVLSPNQAIESNGLRLSLKIMPPLTLIAGIIWLRFYYTSLIIFIRDLILLVGFNTLLVALILKNVNELLDTSPAQVRIQTISDFGCKYPERSNKHARCYIIVDDWPGNKGGTLFPMGRSFIPFIKTGDKVRFETHEGFLDWQWRTQLQLCNQIPSQCN